MATQIIGRLVAVVKGRAQRKRHNRPLDVRNRQRAAACPAPPPGSRTHLSSEIYDEANRLWGEDEQYFMLWEEVAKLQGVLCRLRREEKTPELLAELYGRLADVKLISAQIERLWKCQRLVESERLAKLRRLELMLWPEDKDQQ